VTSPIVHSLDFLARRLPAQPQCSGQSLAKHSTVVHHHHNHHSLNHRPNSIAIPSAIATLSAVSNSASANPVGVGLATMEPSNKKRRLAPKVAEKPPHEQVRLPELLILDLQTDHTSSRRRFSTTTSLCHPSKMPHPLPSAPTSSPLPGTSKTLLRCSMRKQIDPHIQVSQCSFCDGKMI